MSSEWISIPASEFCLSVRDGTHDSPKEVLSGGKNLVTSRHIKGGLLDLSTSYKISGSDYEEINKRSKVDQWDILFSMIGTVGEVLLVKEPPDFAIKNVGLFKSKDETTGKWLYYYLQSPNAKEEIYMSMRGSTQQYIPLGALRSFPIRHPQSTGEMREITNILATLDDKIELNRKTNETLEAMAKALFKSWFVDFDPVRAKAEGRPTGLPAEISDLFPDSFEDSELGEIPSGWRVEAVGDISSNFDSKRVPVSGNDREKRKGGYPYYGATGIVDWIDDYLFDGIYLLIGEDGSVERGDGTAFSQYVSGKIWVNNHAHVLTGAKSVSTEHIYLYFQFIQVAPYVTGAVQLKISQGRLNSIPVVVAPPGINDCFSGLIRQLFDRRITVVTEISTLGSLRDALLPKLISGELRIPDIEKMLEEFGV
jgi:type I restriction enzyme, S subunit